MKNVKFIQLGLLFMISLEKVDFPIYLAIFQNGKVSAITRKLKKISDFSSRLHRF